jgi:hypothetical protein
MYESRLPLEEHLFAEHWDSLHIWGISPQLLLHHRVLNPGVQPDSTPNPTVMGEVI